MSDKLNNEEILAKIRSYQIAREDGCYDWASSQNGPGYPCIYVNGRVYIATRWVVAIKYNVDVNSKFVAMHTCDYKPCTNEDHLVLATQSQNMKDAQEKGRWKPVDGGSYKRNRTHCGHGHEFTPDNIRWYRGYRRCRACDKINNDVTNSQVKAKRHARGLQKSGPKSKK